MIDRDARNKLSELIRSLSAGIITNDEFEDALPHSKDAAVWEVFSHGAWCLYSDLKEYKLKGKDALAEDDRSIVARWILFLKSDNEYTWPSASFREQFLKTISLGVFGQSTLDKWHEHGDVSSWPFTSINQLNEAKLGKGYLGTKNT
ncbi:hypothetical protein KCM76_24880 [Zooshikella marina]|uniref:Uncharacterized protein n=1 Tax=Zooshikella ganghwensis TaxID=202772 RepID=A0A4P9VGT5_9GAMM|nr:hypothetical protein [Zooshikella ganghwensis]MBU2709254.1 hypothetical protein [Zooshikella ganghwensis]RDH41317.1 hypothetical protein B9G39_29040 [Zooshikella ganghwensis]